MRSFLFVALFVVPFASAAACGDSDGGTANGKGGGTGVGGTGASSASDASDGPILAIDGSTYGCSADLHSVVDAKGAVVKACPSDQGCSNGTCIEACAAAAASHGNLGCEFLLPTPMAYYTTLPPCFALALANAWPKEATISVERSGTSYDPATFIRIPANGQQPAAWPPIAPTGIPVDDVGVLFLSSDPASVFVENNVPMHCPITPAVDASTMLDGSGKAAAFRIKTSVPVSAYDVLPFGGAQSHFPSAELVFPTTAWGTNYVVIGTPPGTYSPPGPIWLQILAQDDATSTGTGACLAARRFRPWNLPLIFRAC